MSDLDRYPTEEELKRIAGWDFKAGFEDLIDFIEDIWWNPDWGFRVYEGRESLFRNRVIKLQLHTGGWSGNEDIIRALAENQMFWSWCFWKEYVGGHYWFQIRKNLWKGIRHNP